MNQKVKKEIKEWLELIAMTVLSGIVVLHVNGMFSSNKDNDTKQVQTENIKPVAPQDTIANHALNNVKQLKHQR
ncbi:MAG: hypothetical protein NC311_02560 [Muribaculaceae bacterium]|nr:hypothetical protein [Muribaculaceae bacterium]